MPHDAVLDKHGAFITQTLHVKLLRLQSIGNILTKFFGEVQLVRYGLVDGGWGGERGFIRTDKI